MMRKIGTALMVIGAVLVITALCLFLWNQRQSKLAEEAAAELLPGVIQYIENVSEDTDSDSDEDYKNFLEQFDIPIDPTMTEVEIDGYYYIGYISIPALDLELTVMTDWSYPQLKISHCRYTGSTKTDNLVICAHNYERHFGLIKNLTVGDEVYFTDMDGVVWSYQVAVIETLEPTAIEEMTDSGYPLTLFTCTYGGKTRVTVRCELVEE